MCGSIKDHTQASVNQLYSTLLASNCTVSSRRGGTSYSSADIFRVGSASSEVYKHYLASGARCVEIDAWNDDENEEEPKGV